MKENHSRTRSGRYRVRAQGSDPMKPSVTERIKQRLEEFTHALEGNGVIQDEFTCRKVELNLKPQSYNPDKIRATRRLLRASQSVFALLLGVSVKTVQAWEQGLYPPKNTACRFMDEIRRNPKYWTERLREAASTKGSDPSCN